MNYFVLSSYHFFSRKGSVIKQLSTILAQYGTFSGFPDPAMTTFPRLNCALKGIRRDYSSSRRKARLPITPNVLTRIFKIWSQYPVTFDRLMLWAAFCLVFFGFMRSREFTCPSIEAFTPDMLSPDDIAVNSHTAPSFITVHLKRSKNDLLAPVPHYTWVLPKVAFVR